MNAGIKLFCRGYVGSEPGACVKSTIEMGVAKLLCTCAPHEVSTLAELLVNGAGGWGVG